MAELHYPEGRYYATIKDHRMAKNAKNNNQWVLTIMPYRIENPAAPVDSESRWTNLPVMAEERRIYRVITDKTISYFCDDLDKMEVFVDSFAELDSQDPKAVQLVGKPYPFTCKHETYEGKTREKWELSLGGGELAPLSQDDANQLDALFGAHLMEHKRNKAGGVPAAPVAKKTVQQPVAQQSGALNIASAPKAPFAPPAPAGFVDPGNQGKGDDLPW